MNSERKKVINRIKQDNSGVLLINKRAQISLNSEYYFIHCKYIINQHEELNIIFNFDKPLNDYDYSYELILKKDYQVLSASGNVLELTEDQNNYHLCMSTEVYNIKNISESKGSM